MKITTTTWNKYINKLAEINQKAASLMQKYADAHGLDDMDAIFLYAKALTDKYGEAAAAATCDMYDAIAQAQGVNVPPAVPAKNPTPQEIVDVISYAADNAPVTVPAKVGELVKKTSARTMRKNAARDGAKMALVPSGDGCAFCKMLGSRGWEDARSNKSFEAHLHQNCRCEYVVRFGDDLSVEGYDPDALYDEFMQFDGSWDEKMKKMRFVQSIQDKYGVVVDLSNAKNKEMAFESVRRLNKLLGDYNNTTVSYSVQNHVRSGAKTEAGSAYMLNGRTDIQVLNSALRVKKATDDLGLGNNQPYGITYHEFAHSISQSREKTDPKFWKEMRALFREYRNDGNSPDWFSRLKISSYAETDVDEFMAEAFTQAKLKENPSPYAIRALEIIDKYFKK